MGVFLPWDWQQQLPVGIVIYHHVRKQLIVEESWAVKAYVQHKALVTREHYRIAADVVVSENEEMKNT